MKYQVSRDGRVIGDFSTEDIRHGLQEGSLVVTDYYWTEGMPAWLPLSELPKPPKVAPLAKLNKMAAIPLLLIAIVAGAMIGYDFNAKRIKAQEAEDLNAKLAKVSGRLMDIQSEIVRCDLFLRDFELVDKGQQDAFDKTKPIYPGKYRNRSSRAISEARAFNAEGPDSDGRVPRFRLFAEAMGDGNVLVYVRCATSGPIWRGFTYFDQRVECSLSLDGEVRKIDYELHQTDNGDAKRGRKAFVNHFGISAESLSGLIRELRENKTPRVMMRVADQTADLEFDKRSLLECFDVSGVVIQRKELLEQRRRLEKDFSGLQRQLAEDTVAEKERKASK
jgi:hypothetical protein